MQDMTAAEARIAVQEAIKARKIRDIEQSISEANIKEIRKREMMPVYVQNGMIRINDAIKEATSKELGSCDVPIDCEYCFEVAYILQEYYIELGYEVFRDTKVETKNFPYLGKRVIEYQNLYLKW